MNAVIFDSHQYAKRLIDAGVTPQAASVHAEILLEVMNQIAAGSTSGEKMEARLVARIDRVATELNARLDELNAKIDRVAAEFNAKIDRVAAELNARIDTMAAELRTHVADVKTDVVRWVVSVAILQFALNSALVLKLIH